MGVYIYSIWKAVIHESEAFNSIHKAGHKSADGGDERRGTIAEGKLSGKEVYPRLLRESEAEDEILGRVHSRNMT